ncbi:MAG: A/G-specific adenine glycosylase [Planctomycetota bacterium]
MSKALDLEMLAEGLVAWYRRTRRDLPWRRSKDPYAIWVSEVMLQQTRVQRRVIDRYEQFLDRFPDPASLAAAGDDDLLSAWSGLGYYRRARLMREAARRMVAEHRGRVPEDPDDFGRLPGVGAYTRGAVLSIAHDLPLAAIDGNTERVLARLLALEGDPRRKQGRARLRLFIGGLHARERPGEINQALMELGALLCLPARPRCAECPWSEPCRASGSGRVAEFPQLGPRARMTDVASAVVLVRREGSSLARRVPAGEVNEGQLGLPGLGLPLARAEDLERHLEDEHGLTGRLSKPLASFLHTITRYRIRIRVHALCPPPEQAGRGLVYADPDDPALPWTTVARKAHSLARRKTGL